MTIAVTGADGQLGSELCRQLGRHATPLNRAGLDLTNVEQIRKVFNDLRPQAVINSAAYTQVDKAESEPELCRKINADAVGHLAKICAELNCPLVQISTDYVFGVQSGTGPHDELSPISPESVYAQTKAEGERQAAMMPKHIIVRTCGLYGHADKPNFVKTMLRLGRERSQLKIVADQQCTPSYVGDVAAATLALLDQSAWGLFHVVNEGFTTWYDFAGEIFRQAKIEVELIPLTTEEYGAPAPRPRDSRLDTSKYAAVGPKLRLWQDALAEYLQREGVT